MRRNVTAAIKNIGLVSPATILGILFFFITGISAGVFTELMLDVQAKTQISEYLTQALFREDIAANLPAVFLSSLTSNLGLLLLIVLSGVSVLGFPLAVAAVVYKGMALGFTSALLIESLAVKGGLMVALTMVPPNLLLIPAVLVAAVCAVNLARTAIADRKGGIKKSLTKNAGSYVTIQLFVAAAMVVGCLIESFICPILLLLLK